MVYFFPKKIAIVTLVFSQLLLSISAHAEILLYAPSLITAEQTRIKDPQAPTALAANFEQLNQQQQAIALILHAADLFEHKKYQLAIDAADNAIERFTGLNQPASLANSYYIRAMSLSVGLRQYEQSVDYFKQVHSVTSTAANNALNIIHARAYQKLGSLLIFLKQSDQAYDYIVQAIVSAKQAQASELEIAARLDLAKFHQAKKQTKQGEEVLLEAHKLAIATQSNNLSRVLIQLSRFYRNNQRFDLAIKYGKKAVDLAQTTANEDLAWAYNNLAIAYEESGDQNLALMHYLNVVENIKANGSLFKALAQHNIGLIYLKQEKYTQSFDYLNLANQVFTSIEHSYYLMQSHLSLGEVSFKQQQFQQAIIYLKQALITAETKKDHSSQQQAHQYLAKSHDQQGNYQQANLHHAHVNKLLEQQIEQLQQVQQQQILPQIEQANLQQNIVEHQNQIKQLQQRNTTLKRTQQHYTTAIVICLVMVIVLLILWKLRSKKARHLIATVTRHQNTNLTHLGQGLPLAPIFNEQFKQHQYLVALRLPIASQLTHYMNIDAANDVYQKWIDNLSQALNCPLYCVDDATLIFALSSDAEQNEQALFSQVLIEINAHAPRQLTSNLHQRHPLSLAATSLDIFHLSGDENQATNVLNLVLTLLAGVETVTDTPIQDRWMLAHPKDQDCYRIFSYATRNEWIYSIKNKLLNVSGIGHGEIDWDNITLDSTTPNNRAR